MGGREIEGLGGRGERAERVELRGATGDRLQARDMMIEVVQQRLVEGLLARERAIARGERLVLEGLELGSDIALGILHRLPALVFDRDLVELSLGHLDVEAMHAIELDAQVGDSGARALAALHLEQERAAPVLDCAQLVELGVEAVAYHSAFADQGSGLVAQRRGEPSMEVVDWLQGERRHLEPGRAARDQFGVHRRERRERVAQAREVARPRAFERDARGDALDVRPAGEELRQARMAQPRRRVDEGGDRGVARRQAGGVAQRLVQPLAQPPAAHRGRTAIEQREERGRLRAADGLGDLEVAPRGGVHDDVLALALDAQSRHVGQGRLLRVAAIVEQGAGGGDRAVEAFATVAGEIGGAELARQRARRGGRIEALRWSRFPRFAPPG